MIPPSTRPPNPPQPHSLALQAALPPKAIYLDKLNRFINRQPFKITYLPLNQQYRGEQREAWPRLSRMAINILLIPPMLDEPERVFSGARRTILQDRAKLRTWNIKIILYIKSQNKNRFIRDYIIRVESEDIKIISSKE